MFLNACYFYIIKYIYELKRILFRNFYLIIFKNNLSERGRVKNFLTIGIKKLSIN